MAGAKIHLWSHFSLDSARGAPLWLQLAEQFHRSIESGRLPAGARLPSTRSLERELGISRNTALAAYDELSARGLIDGRHGAGTFVSAVLTPPSLDVARILREAQFPMRTISIQDPDGNAIAVSF